MMLPMKAVPLHAPATAAGVRAGVFLVAYLWIAA